MITTDEKVREFIEWHSIVGVIQKVTKPSKCWASWSNCFEVGIARGEGSTHTFYVYTGPGWKSIDLIHAVRHLVDLAETCGGWPDFDSWNLQNDEGYYERELGLEVSRFYYEDCKRAQDGLIVLLGEDVYSILVRVVMGE